MKVLATDWNVSYCYPVYTGGQPMDSHKLNVYKIDKHEGGTISIIKHPDHDGLLFDSHNEASDYAFSSGLLREF